MKLAGGDLHARAKGQAGTRFWLGGMNGAFADDHSGSNELLDLAVIGATLEECCVAFQLGPEEFPEAVLGNRIPRDGPAGCGGSGLSGGQCRAERGLHVKVAESLAPAQSGRDACIG